MGNESENPFIYKNNRFLLMARVGDTSLHKEWTQMGEHKNFDLFLEYYGDFKNRYKEDCDFYSEAKEGKYSRFYKIIEQWGDKILQYDAIWIMDDDISADTLTIKKTFETFMEYNLLLAQPALTKDSYHAHKITGQDMQFLLRYTNFVEGMAPIFSKEALKSCYKTFIKSPSGWGLDFIWPKLLGYPKNKIAIIDKFAVKHTRPPQSTYKNYKNLTPKEDFKRVCNEYNVNPSFKVYGGIWRERIKIKFNL